MMLAIQRLKELWRGQLPLEIAFWHYAIFYGLLLNVVATAAAVALIVLDVPIVAAVIVHLIPVPYSIVAIGGVWHSADRYDGRRSFAIFAKVAVLAWSGFLVAL
jgi:hypothetical protein